MKAIKCVFVLLVVMGTASGAGTKLAVKEDKRAVVEGNNKFAMELYAKLRAREGNLFFSPYSISTALAMAYAGARNETAASMEKTLCFALPQEQLHPVIHDLDKELLNRGEHNHDSGFKLHTANALWIQKGFPVVSGYLDILSLHYSSSPEYLDFRYNTEKSRCIINDLVSERTFNKINNILGPGMLSPETKLVLTNAIYFEAKWQSPFVTAATRDDEFFPPDGTSVSVPMMAKTGESGYTEGTHFQALEKPLFQFMQ